MRGRLPRHQVAAAVLVGLDRRLVGADLPGALDDLGLVHLDQGPEHRERYGAVDGIEISQRLRRDLPQALARDQGQRPHLPGDALGDAEHEAPVEDDPGLCGGVPHELLLEVPERDPE